MTFLKRSIIYDLIQSHIGMIAPRLLNITLMSILTMAIKMSLLGQTHLVLLL